MKKVIFALVCTMMICSGAQAQTIVSNQKLIPALDHIQQLKSNGNFYIFDIDRTPKDRKEHGIIAILKKYDTIRVVYKNADDVQKWGISFTKKDKVWSADIANATSKIDTVCKFMKEVSGNISADWIDIHEWH